MDVRCEKCQTEYELDEARLKPGGVTVKCTNCGHMFKIRKRSITNVGAPPPDPPRNRPVSSRPPTPARPAPSVDEAPTTRRADSVIGEPLPRAEQGGDDRHWLIRLENGEQKSCRELSALQQWIVGGIVTRESLISRSGKTWKRLGDIAELSQYFNIADEALRARQERSTKPVQKPQPGTMLGVGVSAAGGTILPDDEDEIDRRTTGSFKAKPDVAAAPRRPPTQPPPPPAKKPPTNAPALGGTPQVPAGNRATAAWASSDIAPTESMASMPAGPMAGKIRPIDDEPAFAGRVRVGPSDETGFETGRVRSVDDDDDVVPQQRGGKGGFLLVLMALLVMGAAAGAIYVFVIKKDSAATVASADAGSAGVADAAVAMAVDAAAPPPVVDAAPAQTAVDLAHDKLEADKELDLRDALKSLEGSTEPGADAMRANLIAGIAQGMLDRAVLVEKSDADKLKKDAKALVLEAATPAQKSVKATPDDPGANLAMAAVLRLQGKSAKDIARYLEPAIAKVTPAWKRDIAIGQALALEREKKYDDARALLAPLDESAEDKLEATGDVRVRFRLAMIAFAQNKPSEAKPLVESILAAAPDHAGAKALAAKIETTVVKTDPLPPEDGSGATKPPDNNGGGGGNVTTGGSYDQLLARANTLAESNCTKAIDLFAKALEQKPNGVEALTGMGYCHIDAKQFASAFSKFRAALAVSSRYEPALWGIAEAYMQQGRKEQALEAVKAYLDVYPGTLKGTKALDRLGGGATPPPMPTDAGAGSAAPPPTQTPPPAPTPTPAPTPSPEAPPAGSGASN